MPQVLDWRAAKDRRDVLCQAVETLRRGAIVAFPTEATYTVAASALHAKSMDRLGEVAGRPLTVAVQSHAQALDWAPAMGEVGRRLARRCWPGPVTLAFGEAEDGLASRLPEAARRRLAPNGVVRLRSPAHDAIQSALRMLSEPMAFVGAHREGAPVAVHAAQISEALGDAVDLILDDGPSPYGQAATVVRVNGKTWEIVRPGVVSDSQLRRQSAFLVIFFCTGNTCRSPLAEALCKKLLAERLGCAFTELPERGFLVISAGLAAMMGGAAAPEAVEIARELGADLDGHLSRTLTRELANQADCLVGMTESHRLSVARQFPHLLDRCRLLRADGADVADPIGCTREVYRQCAVEIAEQLPPLVAEWAGA
jgi:protein-tyrosine phosphatase